MSNTPPVSIYSEFQPLEKIIVGRGYNASAFEAIEDTETRTGLQKIAVETEEDCLKLTNIFQEYGAEVLRPEISCPLYVSKDGVTKKNIISDGRWTSAFPNAPLWPRDLTLILGNKMASMYSRNMGRWTEGEAFYDILFKQFKMGAQWVSMPPPLLNDSAQDYTDYNSRAILFHAACFLRCGKDVFHTVSSLDHQQGRGTAEGLDWVKSQFPDFNFRPVHHYGHLDGKIAFLRPGLLLSWIDKEQLPEPLQKWEMIRLSSKESLPESFLDLRKKRFYKEFVTRWLNDWIGSVDETYFDVNVVSLDESTVILNSTNLELIQTLESKGMTCIPFNFRHRHFWDGGLHCMTLDLKRRGGAEDYLS